jgi:hypothetical protein
MKYTWIHDFLLNELANPPGRFTCKTGTEQHTTGPADFMKKSEKNRLALYRGKIEINSSWQWV